MFFLPFYLEALMDVRIISYERKSRKDRRESCHGAFKNVFRNFTVGTEQEQEPKPKEK